MTCVYCSLDEQYVNPLFEVFDGGDFVLSSYRDVEEDSTTMQIFFPEAEGDDGATRAAAMDALRSAMDIVGVSAEIKVRTFPDEDWTLSYRLHFKITEISSRLVVVPTWESHEPAAGQAVLKMDPGMAFGTGKHETTRACLEYIDELSPAIENWFNRITLVNSKKTERLTIDFNLEFHHLRSGLRDKLKQTAIIELKRDGNVPSPALGILWKTRIKRSGFSKYCIGSALTNKDLKSNNFKERLNLINKLEKIQTNNKP